MTIFIDAQSVSDLTSYTGLIACVGRWLERPDLSDDAPDFVRMAEARFRRTLVMPQMDTPVTFTATGSTPLPADFDSMRSLRIGQRPLTAMPPADFHALRSDVSGFPERYLIEDGAILTWPAPDKTYTASMDYRAMLPSLSAANQSNWLLAKHPDAYLYATLIQAEFFGWNDDRIPLIKAALDEVLGEMLLAGNRQRYGAGPLVMRSSVREGLR